MADDEIGVEIMTLSHPGPPSALPSRPRGWMVRGLSPRVYCEMPSSELAVSRIVYYPIAEGRGSALRGAGPLASRFGGGAVAPYPLGRLPGSREVHGGGSGAEPWRPCARSTCVAPQLQRRNCARSPACIFQGLVDLRRGEFSESYISGHRRWAAGGGLRSWGRNHGEGGMASRLATPEVYAVLRTNEGREVASIRTQSWLVPHLVQRDACPSCFHARSGTTCPRGG